jgi:acetyl-CoA synthetase (ADP-forming)
VNLEEKMQIIQHALEEGRTTLSEYESKQVLRSYGIPTTREYLVQDPRQLPQACEQIGFPLVMKGCSPELTHKTEKALILLDIRNQEEAATAFAELQARINSSEAAILVQEMVRGPRELMVGLTRDPQFGPCVMFGLGGIFTEILKDVAFRLAPLQPKDAQEMMFDIKAHKILQGIRGMKPVNLEELAGVLVAVGRIGVENDQVKEIDVNPLIIRGDKPIAVDALIVLDR